MKLYLMLVLIHITFLFGYRDTLYVDIVNGNENNDGQFETNQGGYSGPIDLIRNAAFLSNPGDLIIVLPGDYENTSGIDYTFLYGQIGASSQNGMPSTQDTYDALGLDGSPLGEFTYDPNTWVTVMPKYNWRDSDNKTVLGNNNYNKGAIGIIGKYIKFAGFEIAYTTEGIELGASENILIEDNYIHHIGRVFIPCSNDTEYNTYVYGHGTGVSSSWAAQHITLNRNVIHDTGRLHPGETDPRSGTVVSYPHTLLSNGYYCDELEYWKNHDHGIYVHGGYCTYTNNIIYNSPSGTNGQIYTGPHSIVANNFFYNPSDYVSGCVMLAGAEEPEDLWSIVFANNICIGGTNTGMVRGDDVTRIMIHNNISDQDFPSASSYVIRGSNLEDQTITATILDHIDDKVYSLSDSTLVIGTGLDSTFSMRDYTVGTYLGWFGEDQFYYYDSTSSNVSIPAKDFFENNRSDTIDIGPFEYGVAASSTFDFINTPITDAYIDTAFVDTLAVPNADSISTITKPSWMTFAMEEYGSSTVQYANFTGSNAICLGRPDSLSQYIPQVDAWEVEFYFKSTSTSSGSMLSINDGAYPATTLQIYLLDNGETSLVKGGQYNTQTTATTFNDGNWHHYHVKLPASTSGAVVKIDSTIVSMNNSNIGSGVGVDSCYVGSAYDSADDFIGGIYGIKVYSGNGETRTLSWSDDLNGSTKGTWIGTEDYENLTGGSSPQPDTLHAYLSGTPTGSPVVFSMEFKATNETDTALLKYDLDVSGYSIAPHLDSLCMYKDIMGLNLFEETIAVSDTINIAFLNDNNLEFNYELFFTHDDGDTIITSLQNAPSWINYTDNILSGVPTLADSVATSLIIRASDGIDSTDYFFNIYPIIITP